MSHKSVTIRGDNGIETRSSMRVEHGSLADVFIGPVMYTLNKSKKETTRLTCSMN